MMVLLYIRTRYWAAPNLLILFFLFCCSSAFANNDLVVPEVCAPRAMEMNIFSSGGKPVTDFATVKKILREKNAGNQTINFQNLANAYTSTLNEINRQLKDYRSPLFRFLVNCKNDPTKCHGFFDHFLRKSVTKSDNSTFTYNFSQKSPADSLPFFKPAYDFMTAFPQTAAPATSNVQLTDDEKFRRNVYCDRVIYRALTGEVIQTNIEKQEECVEAPFLVEIGYADELSKTRDMKTCYYKTEINGQQYFKNKYPIFEKQFDVASRWYDKAPDLSLKAIRESFLPLGFLFIMRKAYEDFEDYAKLDPKTRDLNRYYAMLSVAHIFNTFYAPLQMTEQQQSQMAVLEFAKKFIDNKDNVPKAILFETDDFYTKMVLQEAERQYWIDRLKNFTPLLLSPQEKAAYFSYLNQNPYFFNDQTSTFQDFVKNPSIYQNQILLRDSKGRAINPIAPETTKNIAKKLGYNLFDPYEPGEVRNEKQPDATPKIKSPQIQKMIEQDRLASEGKKITRKFLFDPAFNAAYMGQLLREKERTEDAKLEDPKEKWNTYETMFRGVTQYQFLRISAVRIWREIQKRSESSLKHEDPSSDDEPKPLDDLAHFYDWADAITCKGFESTYCNPRYNVLRRQKQEQLWNQIKKEVGRFDELKKNHEEMKSKIQFHHDVDSSRRKYIYDEKFLNGDGKNSTGINGKINEINQYCYDNVADGDYGKNPEKYIAMIDEKMKDFYSTPRLDDLLNQSGSKFNEIFRYNPEKYAINCFTKGRVFGNSYYTDAVEEKIQSVTKLGPGAIPVTDDEGNFDFYASGMKAHDAYKPSLFRLTIDDLHEIEDSIEDTIDDELSTLQTSYRYKNLGNYESFLKESAAVRIGAMLEYIADNPSEKSARYICHLIKFSDADAVQSEKNMQLYGTLAMIITSIPAFYMPAVFAGTISLYQASVSIFVTLGSTGTAIYKLHYYNKKQQLLNVAGVTGDIKVTDAQLVHDVYSKNTAEAWNTIRVDMALLFIFGGRAIYNAGPELKNFFSISFQREVRRRLLSLAEMTRDTAGKIRINLGQQVKSFILNRNNITAAQFNDELMVKLTEGGAPAFEQYLLENWGTQIGKYVWQDIFNRRLNELKQIIKNPQSKSKMTYSKEVLEFLGSSKVSEEKWNEFKEAFYEGREAADNFLMENWEQDMEPLLNPSPTIGQTIGNLFLKIPGMPKIFANVSKASLMTKTYISKWWFDFKNFIKHQLKMDTEKWYKWYPYKLLRKEQTIIRLIDDSKTLQEKTGRAMFSETDIKDLSEMTFYKLGEDGIFYRKIDLEMEEAYKRFIERVVSGPTDVIMKYLKPLIGEELLKDEWIIFLDGFKGKITSIEDCKSLLKSIKYAENQYSTLRAQFRNVGELLDRRELMGTYVYQQRTKQIVEKMNEIYRIAQYVRFKNDIRFVNYLSKYFDDARTDIDKIESAIEKFDPDFKYTEKLAKQVDAEKYVADFEKSNPDYFEMVVHKDGSLEYRLKKVTGYADPFKYEKDFILQEQRYRDDFHKELVKYFKKNGDPVKAYERALETIQQRKTIEFECSLPESFHKTSINRLYRKTAGTIALGTGIMGYYSAHGNEEKDTEWISRFAYELGISLFGGYVQSKIFTNNDGGPWYKITHDWSSGWLLTLMDASIYSVVNNTWNQNTKYRDDISKIILESENIRETVKEFFKAYPDYVDQILQQLKKVEDFMNEMDVQMGKGTLVYTDAEKLALKRGLLYALFNHDGSFNESDLKKDPVFSELIQNGYISDDMLHSLPTQHDSENSFYDVVAKIQYDKAYEEKSGEIKYPFLPPLKLGTMNWAEYRTGSETLDRMYFYPVYDFLKTPFAYLKSQAVYNVLCKGYFGLPGRTSEFAAIGINAAYKAFTDPAKFYLRAQLTGH